MSEGRNPLARMNIAKVTSRAISRDEEVTRRSPPIMGAQQFHGSYPLKAPTTRRRSATGRKSPIFMTRKSEQMKMINRRYQKEMEQTEQRNLWNPVEGSVRPIPRFFPLENTSTMLIGVAASVIAARIVQCCHILSLEATFDDNTATARLQTTEHVEIHVALWGGGSPPRYPKNCILVEIQRSSGKIFTFNRYARHLLAAVKGEFSVSDCLADQKEQKKRFASWTMENQTTSAKKKTRYSSGHQDGTKLQKLNHVVSVIENCSSLLKSETVEESLLAVETLCMYSDRNRVDASTSMLLSEAVLKGYFIPNQGGAVTADEKLGSIQRDILSYISSPIIEPSTNNDSDSWFSSLGIQNGDVKTSRMLRCSSLRILFNMFQNLKNIHHEDAYAILGEWTNSPAQKDHDLLSHFLTILDGADKNTHEAYFAARALCCLCELSSDIINRLNEDGKSRLVVAAALKVGQTKHAKLEKEVENLLRVLGNN